MTIRPCLLKLHAELRNFDTSEVTSAADAYRSRGKEDKAANVAAIEDHLRDLRQQRSKLEATVLEAWKSRDPEGFALKGETEAEIRAREAQEKAAADEKAKIANAPSEKGFTLTGSDRAADVAEAHGQKPMFSRDTHHRSGTGATSQRISADDARALWKNLTAGFKNLPPSHFLASPKQAPGDLLSQIRKAGAEQTIMGAYHEGEVYVFADNIPDLESMETLVAQHELRHYGMEGRYGKDLRSALLALRALNPELKAEAEAKKAEFTDLDDSGAVNEALADKPLGYAQKLKGWKRVVLAMRAWLNAHGYTRLAALFDGVQVTPDEITRDFLYDIEQFYKGPPPRGATQFYGTQFHRAYHGTPHDFERFDASKIGTGEGVQAFGYGLYFAGKREVAEHYRQALSGLPHPIPQKFGSAPYLEQGGKAAASIRALAEAMRSSDRVPSMRTLPWDAKVSDWVGHVKATVKFGMNYDRVFVQDVAHVMRAGYARDEAISAVLNNEKLEPKKPGHLYEVELAPKDNEYLDWDKTYDEQSPEVKAALEMAGIMPEDFEGTVHTGRDIYHDQSLGDDRAASQKLAEAGIPGLKFLDGSSRNAGEGHHNFVIFDDKHVEVKAKFSRKDFTKNATGWVADQSPEMQETLRKAGAWRPQVPLKQRIVGWTADWQTKLKQGMVDQFDPIKSLDFHAYMLARMSKSSAGPLESVLLDGTVYLDKDGAVDVNYEKGGFVARMQKLGGEHDRFFSWVIGNRAERLMGEGKERNFTPEDIARLKTLNQGKMADGKPRQAVYLQALADLNRYNKSVLDMAEKAGLIDAETRPLWEKDFYIPFYRMTEGEKVQGPRPKAGLVRQYAFKTLKGGAEAIGDPMENILKNWAHLIDASMKNNAARASVLAAEKAGVAIEAKEEDARQMAKAMGKKDTVVYFSDEGRDRYFVIDDPFVLDAINSLSFSGFSGPAMKVMGAFKHWLTFGVTISPTFRIRNVMRDSIAMIGANPASYNVLGNVLTGWKATEEGSPVYSSMIAGGGVMRYGSFMEGDNGRNVKRLIDQGVDSATILDSPAKVKAMLRSAYDWWMHVGDRSENVNRAALYQQLRAQGKSHLEASYAARDTMDFSMQGTWAAIRFLTATVPFFNARVQGLYKLGRGAAEDPRRFAYVIGATALASIALLLAYKDDDDWKRREDFDRESFWWFKIGDKAFRIPKPFEIGAIGTLAERAVELFATNDLTSKQFAARMGAVVSQQLSMNPVPQLFMPMAEVWANQNTFTNRPIESQGMEKLSPDKRSGPDTSVFAQLAGKNGLVSPVQIDHLINGYFGWLGVHAVATADLALRPATGAPAKASPKVDDLFVVGDFVKDLPAYQSKYLTRLYDQGKEVQELMADLRLMQKMGATEEAREFLEEHRDKLKLAGLFTSAESQLSKVNQRIKMVQSKTLDPTVKREQLDQLYKMRNRLAELTEDRVREASQ